MIPVNIVVGTLVAFLLMLILIRCDEMMRNKHVADLEDQLVDQMHRADRLVADLRQAREKQ